MKTSFFNKTTSVEKNLPCETEAVSKATNYTNFHELKIFLFPYTIDYQSETISVNSCNSWQKHFRDSPFK